MPKAKFSPYIGAGINWTLFFNQEKSAVIIAVNYTNSVGPAFQAGLDAVAKMVLGVTVSEIKSGLGK